MQFLSKLCLSVNQNLLITPRACSRKADQQGLENIAPARYTRTDKSSAEKHFDMYCSIVGRNICFVRERSSAVMRFCAQKRFFSKILHTARGVPLHPNRSWQKLKVAPAPCVMAIALVGSRMNLRWSYGQILATTPTDCRQSRSWQHGWGRSGGGSKAKRILIMERKPVLQQWQTVLHDTFNLNILIYDSDQLTYCRSPACTAM